MNWWILGAGLGMVRFGMEMFEEAIKKLGGPKLSIILQKYTDTGWKATLVGTIITGILNSSTLVSLLTLGFVSAGMMKLVNAVGVLVGANIGSTATGIIVGYLGFGEFKISAFALPLIAIGGAIMIFSSNKYRGYRAKLLIGFGLFFLGIDFLKENMEIMSTVFNFEQYKDMNLWIFGGIGLIITALVQSSGAVGIMTIAALQTGIITFEAGFAIILGANIGTTFTALIASLTGSTAKRQIGIANVLFNVITVIVGIIFFYPYIWITLDLLGFRSNPVMGNPIINLVFNATTSLIFVPFLNQFTRLIQRSIPETKEEFPLQILQQSLQHHDAKFDTEKAQFALKALKKDKKYITQQVKTYITSVWNIDPTKIKNPEYTIQDIITHPKEIDNETHKKLYITINNELDLLFEYIQTLSSMQLDVNDRKILQQQLDGFIGLSNACKSIENIRENIAILRATLDPNLRTIYQELTEILLTFSKILADKTCTTPLKKTQLLTQIEVMRQYRNNILTHTASYINNGNIGDMDVSSLVNINGELTDCLKNMVKIIA